MSVWTKRKQWWGSDRSGLPWRVREGTLQMRGGGSLPPQREEALQSQASVAKCHEWEKGVHVPAVAV